jgi:uncharacterized protein YoxC
MIIEVAVLLGVIAFAVLVGYLIATLVEIRKTAVELEVLLNRINHELPSLLKEIRLMTENVNVLTDQARAGVEHASVFLHAVGQVGATVQQVRGLVSGQNLLSRILSGVWAATAVVKERLAQSRGENDGAL